VHSPCNRYFLTLLAISTIASHEIPGQQRVADMLSFRVARCFGRSSHDHCDDLVHHSTISAAVHSGTGISISWDGYSIAGTGPDRLTRRVVAFPFLVADLDAVGGVFRPCRCRRRTCTCYRPLAARLAWHRARARGAHRGRSDCLCAVALRSNQTDSAANPRHHVRSGQSAAVLSRSCRCGKAKASIRWPMKAPRLRNSNAKLIRTLSR